MVRVGNKLISFPALFKEFRPLEKAESRLEEATIVLTTLCAVTQFFSIAAAQILLGAALLTLLLSRRPLHFPQRLGWAIVALAVWTLLSIVFSRDPLSGLSYLRKFFLFFVVVLVYNVVQDRRRLWTLLRGIVAAGTIAALYGVGQFAYAYFNLKRQGLPFYENYVLHQASGFMSHWLTFAAQLMMVFLITASVLFFSHSSRGRPGWWLAAAAIALGILAAFTRGVWLGTFVGTAYLLARFRRKLLWLLPLAFLVFYLISPTWLERRMQSMTDLKTDTSNQSRPVMARTGWEMIRAHPWFGVGPGRVEVEFLHYKPASLPLPRAWYGHLHNTYLQFAAERGIPFLLLWLWLVVEVILASLSLTHGPGERSRAVGHAVVAVTLGTMVSGLFEFNFGDSEVLMLYLFLVATAFAGARLERQHAEASEEQQ
ncbi:MAG: O-antigen ligase family protein [Acidobacteria bacterium]|nr:O-antigen ligase family protein [Acidobacteriota bacterium]